MKSISAKTLENKIDLFIRVADEDHSGYLSVEELLNLSRQSLHFLDNMGILKVIAFVVNNTMVALLVVANHIGHNTTNNQDLFGISMDTKPIIKEPLFAMVVLNLTSCSSCFVLWF